MSAAEHRPVLDEHTGYLVRRAQQAHVAAWARIVSAEVSSVQYAVLVELDRLGEASQKDLCAGVDLDRSTIAVLVARMERHGLVARRRDPDDGRRNTVTLTERGTRERARLAPLVEQVERELTGGMSAADREGLRRGLRRLLEPPTPV